jgi:ubiquitin-large subunit ribosomal protein L40e
MQIFVKTLTGKTITLEVEGSDSTSSLVAKIQEREGIPPEMYSLKIYSSGKFLKKNDSLTLSDYNINKRSIISMEVPHTHDLQVSPNPEKHAFIKTYLETYFNDLKRQNVGKKALLYINISVPLEARHDMHHSPDVLTDVFNTFPSNFDIVDLILFNPAFHDDGVQSMILSFFSLMEWDRIGGPATVANGFNVSEFVNGEKTLRVHFPPQYIPEIVPAVELLLLHKPSREGLNRYMDITRDNLVMYAYANCCYTGKSNENRTALNEMVTNDCDGDGAGEGGCIHDKVAATLSDMGGGGKKKKRKSRHKSRRKIKSKRRRTKRKKRRSKYY